MHHLLCSGGCCCCACPHIASVALTSPSPLSCHLLVCVQVSGSGSGSWAVQAPPEQLALVLADTQTLAGWTLTAYWEGLHTLLSVLPAQVRCCPKRGAGITN